MDESGREEASAHFWREGDVHRSAGDFRAIWHVKVGRRRGGLIHAGWLNANRGRGGAVDELVLLTQMPVSGLIEIPFRQTVLIDVQRDGSRGRTAGIGFEEKRSGGH